MELDEVARTLTILDDRVFVAVKRIDSLDQDTHALGGDGPGRLGEVGRALAARCETAVAARRAEAKQLTQVIDDLADSVRRSAANYRDLEDRRARSR